MYVIVFDKSGESLSGWHYNKLHEFEAEWIQQSVIKIEDFESVVEFVGTLQDFGVEDVEIFKAKNITNGIEDYVGT